MVDQSTCKIEKLKGENDSATRERLSTIEFFFTESNGKNTNVGINSGAFMNTEDINMNSIVS